MCGIAGVWSPGGADLSALAREMAGTLAHRGPDGEGVWAEPDAGLALGHRRLAVLELSPLGAQPMLSADGRYVLVFNGEIYNHPDLRRELEALGHRFRGGSDTETFLAACVQWGPRAAVERCAGMFALALWDRRERALRLVRDRLGVKPLYYGRAGSDLVFGSELKALTAHPGFDRGVDRDALTLFFRHAYIPAPHTIHPDARKLRPGTILTLRSPSDPGVEEVYWDAERVWREGAAAPFAGGEEEAAGALESLLSRAVEQRLLSDVPLGALLSGGVDSSLVTALMSRRGGPPPKTYTIGFREAGFDEAPQARAVAEYLGTEHTELYVGPAELLEAVPEIPRHWDEPFGDSSQIPTLLVCRLARRHVTVCLGGDGGDELFLGYERYRLGIAAWNMLRRIPAPLRGLLAGIGGVVPWSWYRALGVWGVRVGWRMEALRSPDLPALYRYLCSHSKIPASLVLGGKEPTTAFTSTDPSGLDHWAYMSLVDVKSYLPDDILVKVDRAGMAFGLELRSPFLDHRLAEFAASLPTAMRAGKRLLRRVLHRHVPPALVERPKMGFGAPVARWLRGELRPWCEDLLDPARLRRQGFLDAGEVGRMWREFLGGREYWQAHLWDALMFQAWLAARGD